jgi:tetratricopeptide (TPR) repeat protein
MIFAAWILCVLAQHEMASGTDATALGTAPGGRGVHADLPTSWTTGGHGADAPQRTRAHASLPERERDDLFVSLETVDGLQWCTLRARVVSLELVLEQLARASQLDLETPAGPLFSALVTAELEHRPFEQVLEYVLGSAGLRHELRSGTITILDGPGDEATRDEALALASAAWSRAEKRFPGRAEAAGARLARGEILELEGRQEDALALYQTLAEDYAHSPEMADATLRTGRILERQGAWSEASLQFRVLAAMPEGAEFHAVARLEVARCAIETGDPQSALHLLASLDANYPAHDRTEVTARTLVRAAALNARGRHMEALRAIEEVQAELDPLADREALGVRALALEGAGLPVEAGRAWLVFARRSSGADRRKAYEHAARLALEADDELAVLFVCREAERNGMADGLGRTWRAARERLGYDVQEETATTGIAARIAQGEAWLAANDLTRARPVFEALYLARGALAEDDAARVVAGWAACVAREQGLEQALDLLRESRPRFETLQARSRLDLMAAKLLEAADESDRSIAAYEGRY